MLDTPRLPLWRGRALALLGILLIAANLRTAVAGLSPIFAEIRVDFALTNLAVGVLGMLPPVCFAVAGIVVPTLTRKATLELVMVFALGAMVIGDLVRAASDSIAVLIVGSVITFAGMGVGNVLLPPLVKRYFPDRVGLVTSLYATVLSFSTLVPPLVAVPVTMSAGWRVSVGMWAALALVAVVPWVTVLVRHKPAHPDHDVEVDEPQARVLGRVWHAPIAWALAIVFGVSSFNAYALFAWLPEILRQTAGVNAEQAGALLSLYAAMGIPAGLLVPVLTTRLKNVGLLIYAGVAFFVIGYLGLIFVPGTATWLWVVFAGLGPLLFPLTLVLINLRTRSHSGAVALSGFTQGIGYALGALGPLLVGLLHDVTGAWTLALVVLTASAAAAAIAGFVVARPHKLEDTMRRRRRRVGRAGS